MYHYSSGLVKPNTLPLSLEAHEKPTGQERFWRLFPLLPRGPEATRSRPFTHSPSVRANLAALHVNLQPPQPASRRFCETWARPGASIPQEIPMPLPRWVARFNLRVTNRIL